MTAELAMGIGKSDGGAPLVSIIIRNYNYVHFLRDAIESALAQTYRRNEIIVVDDGSTDGSREILRQYEDRCVIVLQENGGEGEAINAGFAVAKGQIVLFLDSDDILSPTAISQIVSHWDPRFTRFHYKLDVISEDGTQIGATVPCRDIPDMSFEDYLATYGEVPGGGQSCNAYAASALRAILPLDPALWRRAPDCYLNTLTRAQGETCFVAGALGSYRWHRTNLSLRNSLFLDGSDIVRVTPNLFGAVEKFVGPDRWASVRARIPSGHLLNRILSLRLNRDGHPFQEDRLIPLALGALRAIASRPLTTVGRRALLATGLAAAVILPRPLLQRALPFMLQFSRATGQPGWLKRAVAVGRLGIFLAARRRARFGGGAEEVFAADRILGADGSAT